MNSYPVEAGDNNLFESRLGKPDERVGGKDRQKNAGYPALSVRPHGAEGDVALASWSSAIETDRKRYNQMMKLPRKQRERLHYLSPGPNREKERSRTFTGIADAMAKQWGPS